MDSIYWVVSRDCNQRCRHCYNDSEPGAPGLTLAQVATCVAHLPDPDDVAVGRVILSGGEVLVWPELLLGTLGCLYDRYGKRTQLMVQTNGDLLDDAMLDRLLLAHVQRIDVSGMDQYHPISTLRRRDHLQQLFRSRGMIEAGTLAATAGDDSGPGRPVVYAFWGATEDTWIGRLWPRGRARKYNLSMAGPDTDICGAWSGAKGFLDYQGEHCEVNVQLADVYPCCPMTCRPIGTLLAEPLLAILDRCAQHPVYRALNEGRPEAMGEYLGISEEEGRRRAASLGNHCLWCDEFFTLHAPELPRDVRTVEK
jgi:hypothetical protein